MAREIVLGIDLGTTVLKLCAFERARGTLLAEATRRLRVDLLPEGGRETPIPALDAAFASALREVRAALGSKWRRLAGIGVAAQGGSSIIAERTSGAPRTPMLLWNDGRAWREQEAIVKRAPGGIWRRSVLSDFAPPGLGRLVWMRGAWPELFTENHIHIGAGEYLFFRLTGTWRQDAGNAIQIGAYNAAKRRLDASLLGLIDIPPAFFAPLREGHGISPLSGEGARLFRAERGIPVAGPYIDQEAGYLAAAGVARRPLDCSLGTAWVGNFVLPSHLEGWSPLQLVIPPPAGAGRLVILPLATGNGAWEWALRELAGGASLDAALRRAAALLKQVPAPPEGLVALPWFNQPNPLRAGAAGAGVLFGLGERCSRADLLRAVAVGMVCESARALAAVKESGAVDGLVLSGGASRGDFFRRALATLFAPLPCFVRPRETSPAARGAVCAFGPEVAAAGARRIPPPGGRFADSLRSALADYLEAFDRVYGDAPAGRAYRIADKPRRRGPEAARSPAKGAPRGGF